MATLQEAVKRAGQAIEVFGARFAGYPVVESPDVTPGEVLVSRDPREILVYKPTENERIVRLGVRKAHPWFRDPLDPQKFIK